MTSNDHAGATIRIRQMSHRVASPLVRPALVGAAFVLVACSGSYLSGHAERVDVPVRVSVSLTEPPTSDCHAHGCALHVKAVITNQGEQHVWAMFCQVVAHDADGAALARLPLSGPPAGFGVDPGRSTTDVGVVGPISKRRAPDVNGLSGACRAYVWHGQVPI
jgi:hypothetical protein